MKKALFVLLALAGAFAVWSIQAGDETGPPVLSEPVPTTGEAAEETPLTVDTDTLASEPGEATEETDRPGLQREELQATLPPETTVTLKGRCVDATSGLPLAGCEVRVRGSRGNSARMDVYLATHERVVWENPEPVVTDSDGAFSFTFVPPPPYQFMLTTSKEGTVPMAGRWSELPPGTVKDYGDVPIATGATVAGRVLDTDGVPQDGVDVYLNDDGPVLRDGLYPRGPSSATSNADGTFAFPGPVPSGEWTIRLRGRQLLEPEKLIVEERELDPLLNIVVKKLSDIETITGIVVDQLGVPVHSADVDRSGHFFPGGIHSTERDGTFRLERRDQDSREASTIRVEKAGYEVLTTDEAYPWGTSELRLVLRRAVEIEILVTDAETGEPVEGYGVRCYIDPATTGRWSSAYTRMRHRGNHEGGRLLLTGVRRGRNLLSVHPTGTDYLPSLPIILDVTDRGAPRQHVELSRPTRVTLEVIQGDGDPVPGTEVELIRTLGDSKLDLQSAPADPNEFNPVTGNTTSILLHRGTTDALGQLELSGPAGTSLALRLLGPGHQPFVVDDLYLDPARDPLRVQVPSGATITGTIRPASVLEAYRGDPERLQALSRGSEVYLNRLQTGVSVQRPGDRTETFPLENRVQPLGGDGRILLEGVPTGEWDLYLRLNVFHDGDSYGSQSILLDTLRDLREGEVRPVEYDISHLAKARVTGTLFLNGIPRAGAALQLSGTRIDARGGSIRVGVGNFPTGPEGEFATDIVPGDYQFAVQVPLSSGRGWTYVPCQHRVSVGPGQTVDQAVRIHSSEVRLQILGSDGRTPAKGVSLYAWNTDRSWTSAEIVTDDEGLVQIEHTPLEALIVRAWPAHLSTMQARMELPRQNPGDWTEAMVGLGTVQPLEGAPLITFVMPEGSGY